MNTRTELWTRGSESLPRQGRDHLFQWDVGVGFFTEITGSLRNPEARRTPSCLPDITLELNYGAAWQYPMVLHPGFFFFNTFILNYTIPYIMNYKLGKLRIYGTNPFSKDCWKISRDIIIVNKRTMDIIAVNCYFSVKVK